MSVTCSWYKSC